MCFVAGERTIDNESSGAGSGTVIDATSVELAARDTFVAFEAAKVAMSLGPLGTVAGVQFAAVLQSPVLGLTFQVALPANEWTAIMHENMQTAGKSLFIPQSQQEAAPISRQYGQCCSQRG